ncbi:hypothetical protein EK21DRAFT_70528, partial [Setomelanomma holmii]
PYIRVVVDAVPDRSIFVYKYYKSHLLSFGQRDMPLTVPKRVLSRVRNKQAISRLITALGLQRPLSGP